MRELQAPPGYGNMMNHYDLGLKRVHVVFVTGHVAMQSEPERNVSYQVIVNDFLKALATLFKTSLK